MHTSRFLPALLAALPLVAANPAPFRPMITPAPLPPHVRSAVSRHAVNARQDDQQSLNECEESLFSLDEEMPTETGEVAEWLSTARPLNIVEEADMTQYCSYLETPLTPPASLSSAYSELLEQQASWRSSVAPLASSLASVCEGTVSVWYELIVATDEETCTELVSELVELAAEATTTSDEGGAPNTSTPTATTTGAPPPPTDGASDDNNPPETTTSEGAAAGPRETGFVAVAAVAAVAVAGAVAGL